MTTPHTDKLSQRIAAGLLTCFGWAVETDKPKTTRYVIVVAPHTSNWDFPWGYLAKITLDLRLQWMGKHSLFHWPYGWLMKWLGGIPVDRRSRNNFIGQMASRFRTSEEMILVITPEGTRGYTDSWKSGFYHIARAAEVPVALAYIDYRRKRIGLSEPFMTSGDIDADMERIRDFYSDKVGKHPANMGEIRVLSRSRDETSEKSTSA